MIEFKVQTSGRTDFVDITAEVRRAVRELGVSDGAVMVWVPHTTAGVTVNEGADPDVVRDMSAALDRIVPWRDGYRHAEGNSAAHIKSSLYGCSAMIPVCGGELFLGTWQAIWFCEFDGPRRRRATVHPVGAPGA